MTRLASSRWRDTVFTLAWLVGAAQFAACLVALWLPWGGEYRDAATGSIHFRNGLQALGTPAAWVVLALAALAMVAAVVRGWRTRIALTSAAVATGATWLALVTRVDGITGGGLMGAGLALVLVALPGAAVACAAAAAACPPTSQRDRQHRVLQAHRVTRWGPVASLVATGLSVWGAVTAAYAVSDDANVRETTASTVGPPAAVAGAVALTTRPAWGTNGLGATRARRPCHFSLSTGSGRACRDLRPGRRCTRPAAASAA